MVLLPSWTMAATRSPRLRPSSSATRHSTSRRSAGGRAGGPIRLLFGGGLNNPVDAGDIIGEGAGI